MALDRGSTRVKAALVMPAPDGLHLCAQAAVAAEGDDAETSASAVHELEMLTGWRLRPDKTGANPVTTATTGSSIPTCRVVVLTGLRARAAGPFGPPETARLRGGSGRDGSGRGRAGPYSRRSAGIPRARSGRRRSHGGRIAANAAIVGAILQLLASNGGKPRLRSRSRARTMPLRSWFPCYPKARPFSYRPTPTDPQQADLGLDRFL